MEEVTIGKARILHGDCLTFMRELPDKFYDLAIVDPPYFEGVAKSNFYGSEISKTGVKRLCSKSDVWDNNIPNKDYFSELMRISKNQIIWGINYYEFSNVTGRIVWDKKNDTSTFSNCEIASCSLIKHVKIFRYEWNGMLQGDMKNKEQRIHPTQKPVKLYEFCFTNYAKQGDKIFDSHGGSMSSVIAALNLGFEITCLELDSDYYAAGVARVRQSQQQARMFEPEVVMPKQASML